MIIIWSVQEKNTTFFQPKLIKKDTNHHQIQNNVSTIYLQGDKVRTNQL